MSPHAGALSPGLATGIGSLPHRDAHDAAALTLRVHPRLPAVPQLPELSPREGLIAQWAGALPEVTVARDGTLIVDRECSTEPPRPAFSASTHAGLFAFLEASASLSVPRMKVQVVGPLTLGVALEEAGLPKAVAFRRAGEAVRAWVHALDELLTIRMPHTPVVLFLDEPALVLWRRNLAPLDREQAVDLLSSSLAATSFLTGVHVCGDGDLRLAFEAGPSILGVPVSDALITDADVLARHIDADGWVAWGAVPTDRPIGDSTDALWRRLVSVWCELTRRGCDPVRLRTRGVITPACGLAGHGLTQADRALRLAAEIAGRVGDQSVAARLTVGA
ncbi:MAG: hypothetical protein ACXVJW_08975 [Acidimicrobiia bacterium]